MIFVKSGVKITGARPELLLGLMICEQVFRDYGSEVTITELTGGTHMKESKHYLGFAADIRSKHLPTEVIKYKILQDCARALGDNYDIIYENPNHENQHFHLEFDPT